MCTLESLHAQLSQIISAYDNTDFFAANYKEVLILNHLIEKLVLKHNTSQLNLKASLLKEQDFEKIFVLNQSNYKDLVALKKLYKDKKGIYILSFSNGKNYVGQTNNLCRRLDEYFDINNHCYVGHNEDIKLLFKEDPILETTIYFLEAEQDRNFLEATYIEKLKSNDPLYGYNKTGGND